MGAEISVIVPVRDGASTLPRCLAAIRAQRFRDYEVVVVDDGSRDGTAAVAGRLGVRLLKHPANRGYGAALKTGIRAAAGRDVLICDGDGTYPPASIPLLLAAAETHEMAVAARTGPSVAIGVFRRGAKGILRRLAVYLSESEIPDLNSGLRIFRRSAVMRYFPILPSGFSFTTTITLAMLCNERPVAYVPIDYAPRKGRSKIRPLRDTLNFLILIMRTILYFNPLRIFLPVSLLCGLLFLGSLVYDVWALRNLTEKTLILLFGAAQLLAIGVLADLITKRLYETGE
jgi:glycosyltransferase involved in cell wall biosynthesis